jgi:hypothetical protein
VAAVLLMLLATCLIILTTLTHLHVHVIIQLLPQCCSILCVTLQLRCLRCSTPSGSWVNERWMTWVARVMYIQLHARSHTLCITQQICHAADTPGTGLLRPIAADSAELGLGLRCQCCDSWFNDRRMYCHILLFCLWLMVPRLLHASSHPGG